MKDIVEIALCYCGHPSVKYTFPDKGNTPDGFDCSGFVQWVLSDSGLLMREFRNSRDMFDKLGFFIHEPAKWPGDLVFFSGNGYRPTHLGIYIGEEKMIHSPGKDNKVVGIISIGDYCSKNRQQYKPHSEYPQIYFQDPIGFKRVTPHLNGNIQ